MLTIYLFTHQFLFLLIKHLNLGQYRYFSLLLRKLGPNLTQHELFEHLLTWQFGFMIHDLEVKSVFKVYEISSRLSY